MPRSLLISGCMVLQTKNTKILMTQQGGWMNDKKEKRKSYRRNLSGSFLDHDSKGILGDVR